MSNEIERRIRELKDLAVGQLRTRYEALTGEGSRSSNRRHLTRRIAWRLQAKQEGGISERALRRAEDLADVEGLRLSAPKARDVSESGVKSKRRATGRKGSRSSIECNAQPCRSAAATRSNTSRVVRERRSSLTATKPATSRRRSAASAP